MNETRSNRWVTIPNVLCMLRLIGSFAIIPLAIAERPYLALGVFLVLAVTDWIDGKVARWFDQRSRIGPKLDSLADVMMYVMLLFAVIWLRSELFLQELAWLVPGGTMFLVACGASLAKFGVLPSYHTRSAKTSWFLTIVAAVALFLDWSVWPLRVAAISVFIANLESIAITATLSESKTDVISYWAARRRSNAGHQSQDTP
jgi:CDP-diacylglycerol--glycerol-3-phosphate 3-phosphatidyltransferase